MGSTAAAPDQPDNFWSALSPEDRRSIARIATRKRFAPGEFLCREGDRSQHVQVLLEGYVKVLTRASTEREVVIAIRGPGDVVGELAAVDNEPRVATLQAIDTVEALVIPGKRFVALCRSQARLAWVLLTVVASRLREAGRWWVEFAGGSTTRRVAAILVEFAISHGRRDGEDIIVTDRATQQELAAITSLSRETVSRVLRELRGLGLITTGRRKVIVHDLTELRRLAR
jgi:CRP/FNR family cyclic AMP-dependent transcriptional regulator